MKVADDTSRGTLECEWVNTQNLRIYNNTLLAVGARYVCSGRIPGGWVNEVRPTPVQTMVETTGISCLGSPQGIS